MSAVNGRRFEGRAALVTGGGHGIGAATVIRLAAEGASVAVVDLDRGRAEGVAGEIRAAGGAALGLVADVSVPAELAAAVDAATTRLGPLDVVHSNAGVLIPGSALEQSVEDWDRTFAVNVRAAFLTAKAVLPGMVERRAGSIVFTASTSALVGEPGLAAYDASKAALVNMTRQLAADYSPRGIRVNCVCPGWIPTGFNDPALAGMDDEAVAAMVRAAVPMGRQGAPEEIAAAVAYLASDDASYVTGHALVVDGGLTAV